MSSAQHQHFKEIIGHTLDNAAAVGHGHAMGHQGGHALPSDSNSQRGGYISRGALQNRQNTSTKRSNEQNADNPASKDYGVADSGDTSGT
jgi:hypothetical protein